MGRRPAAKGNKKGEFFTIDRSNPVEDKNSVTSGSNFCNSDCSGYVHACRQVCLDKRSEHSQIDSRARLITSIDCIRHLLLQGLIFCGHDESEESTNECDFLELLHFLADHNDEVKRVAWDNAPRNLKLTSPNIQRDIVNAFATETTKAIRKDISDNMFSVIVDEVHDISGKEQVVVILRFVDDRGYVLERILGIVHAPDNTVLSLKMIIEALLCKYGLDISNLRGQGYGGASYMRGGFNDLKSLFMIENESAHYTHCFAHQLQLVLVSVAENQPKIEKFFFNISLLNNVVSESRKRKDLVQTKAFEQVIKALSEGDNQSRSGKTHYRTLVAVIVFFDPLVDMLLVIQKDSSTLSQRAQSDNLLDYLLCFEFAFCLFLMKDVLGISNALCQELHRKDRDMINSMLLVRVSKLLLQKMRDEQWELLFDKVVSFCTKHNIDVPKMEDIYVIPGRARRNVAKITNEQYYRELFNEVINKQLMELNGRFNEVNTELLLCMSCLDPTEAFLAFDKGKLIRFAEFYPDDFFGDSMRILEQQLDNFVVDVRLDDRFANLTSISELSKRLVQTKKHLVYPVVYVLIKFALLLPVATATVERVSSSMKFIQSSLRDRLADEFMNDCLVMYIERDMVKSIKTEDIIVRFQEMSS